MYVFSQPSPSANACFYSAVDTAPSQTLEYSVPSWWGCLQRFRGYSLAEGNTPGVGLDTESLLLLPIHSYYTVDTMSFQLSAPAACESASSAVISQN